MLESDVMITGSMVECACLSSLSELLAECRDIRVLEAISMSMFSLSRQFTAELSGSKSSCGLGVVDVYDLQMQKQRSSALLSYSLYHIAFLFVYSPYASDARSERSPYSVAAMEVPT
jgi:hypothetical protein